MTDLLLSYDFPPMTGGIARWMREVAVRYPPEQLIVSTGSLPDADDRGLAARVDRIDVPSRRLRTIGGLIAWRARVRALVDAHDVRFVWCGNIRPAAYVAWQTWRQQRVPYGILLHGGDLLQLQARYRRGAAKRVVARQLLGKARWLVANSQWTAATAASVLAELGLPGPVPVVVPLGTDPVLFTPAADAAEARRRHGIVSPRYLLTVARLVPHKGIDVGIEAFAALRGRFPDLGYVVVGRGPDRGRLGALAERCGVRDAVRFLEDVPDADLPGLYAGAAVYLGLSRQEGLEVEGFGIALADAAGAGVPVVAGASGGTAEAVVDGVSGVRIDPVDASAAAKAVATWLDRPDLAREVGRAGRQWALSRGNWDRVVADLGELSRSAASSGRP